MHGVLVAFFIALSALPERASSFSTSTALLRPSSSSCSPRYHSVPPVQLLSSPFLLAESSARPIITEPLPPVVEPLSPSTTIVVFIVGIIPFAIATYEFWRRIAVGESFGTTSDSVVFTIGEDTEDRMSSRGQQVLGKDALITAYIIFAVVAAVLLLVLTSVITSGVAPPPPDTPILK